ncbi:MAG: 7-carboxy-7-deazaguanine synthase QueE [Nocardiopsaceae bacterium]|nr:7-carboxy-7-deazaguanine synthase QueE [Nocardiopsaceae bacterium]
MSGTDLVISELFGPTFQGEGPSIGRLASFMRLSGCPLSCQWCDTPWTWQWGAFDKNAEQHAMAAADVVAWARVQRAGLLVITGGEPLVQARQLAGLVPDLIAACGEVEIETSGIIAPPESLAGSGARYNVSPKLANSGIPEHRRIRGSALRAFAGSGTARFKFVAQSPSDLDEIARLQDTYGLEQVWVMPEATSSGKVVTRMRQLADAVISRGWNLSPRLHVLLWEDTRGR